jgi:hypothetical protein
MQAKNKMPPANEQARRTPRALALERFFNLALEELFNLCSFTEILAK